MSRFNSSKPFQPALLDDPDHRPRFVLHLHLGPHLHFDFRIEMGDELADFALPDGPSSDPGVRVRAIRMHDHKKSILNFEGIMRMHGQEAGRLVISDNGEILPEGSDRDTPENLIRNGLDTGYLRLTVFGERMKGDYILQREEEAWSLRKVDDDGKFSYLLGDLPTSVISGKTIQQLED